jgi:hypothetical protein
MHVDATGLKELYHCRTHLPFHKFPQTVAQPAQLLIQLLVLLL